MNQAFVLQKDEKLLNQIVGLKQQGEDYFYKNIYQLQDFTQSKTAIIRIVSKTNLNTFLFDKISFQNNNYSTCHDGILYFEEIGFHKLKLSRFDCINNYIQNEGCLHIVANINSSNYVQIINSNFIGNNGTSGVAIKGKLIFLKLDQSKIISNIALTSGGGLYLLNIKNVIILNSILIENKSNQGGGIYFDGNHTQKIKSFFNTFLNFNKASTYGNNLVESPSQLSLFINSKEMSASDLFVQNTSTRILKIKPYKVIEYGKNKLTNLIMIPSSQVINNYQVFILQKSAYVSYIKNMDIVFQNSMGELLYNLDNMICEVSDFIFTKDNQIIQGSFQNKTLSYQSQMNKLQLGTLEFNFDPYQTNYSHLQIQISCKIQQSQHNLKYIINAQSFKCQLGEFHIQDGCQICQSSQGFYTVSYDAIKCSIFDKTKFQSITSNMINLKQGYWRPNLLSDNTEECYKNKKFCLGQWEVGDISCISGHIGALCEICDVYNIRGEGKFFRNEENLQCLSCSGKYSTILPFLFTLFSVLFSIILTLKSISKSNALFSSLRIFQRQSKIIFKLNQGNSKSQLDLEGILLKILLNYLWIFSSIFTFNINFSFSIVFIEQSSNSFYFMVNNLDCYLSELKLNLIYIKVFLVLLLILLQFYLIIIIAFIYNKFMQKKTDNSLISSTLSYLYILNYAGLIKMLCSNLAVRKISNINYFQGDVSLLFDRQEHHFWISFLILPLLLIFGFLVPLCLFLLMFFKRHKLNKIKLRKHFCYLFNEYNEKTYYWEQIKLIQKASIILVITNFEKNILLKTTLLGLFLNTYLSLALKKQPYIISKLNNLDLQSGQTCVFSIFMAAVKYENQNKYNDFFSFYLEIILIVLLLKLAYPFILNIAIIYQKKYVLNLLVKIHSSFKYFNLNFKWIIKFGSYLDIQMGKKKKLQINFQKMRQLLQFKSETEKKDITSFTKRSSLRSTANIKTSFMDINNQQL